MQDEKEIKYEESNSERVIQFFRDNMLTFILIIVCVVFIFRGLIEIQAGKKTVIEIIADAFISLVMGYSITIILGKKGIASSQQTKRYYDTMAMYGAKLDDITPHIDKMDTFCDYKNDLKLKRIQTTILRKARLKYELFIENKYDIKVLDKTQKKAIVKANKVRMYTLTADNIMSEASEDYDKGKAEVDLTKYERSTNRKAFINKILCAVIFGYFGVAVVQNPSWENIIWSSIQVSIWLLFGFLQYYSNYQYVQTVHRNKIIRKTNYMCEFEIMIKNNNTIFKEEKKNEFN